MVSLSLHQQLTSHVSPIAAALSSILSYTAHLKHVHAHNDLTRLLHPSEFWYNSSHFLTRLGLPVLACTCAALLCHPSPLPIPRHQLFVAGTFVHY